MGYALADRINETKVMLAGLKANVDRLAKRGISTEFITKLQGAYDEVCAIDNAHEALKARLKESTAQLWNKMDEMNVLYQEGKKVIKMDIPQESWKEYGFADKR